jgi:hypothetical protein
MTTDSFFALMIGSMIALFFGFVLTVAGYRFFIFLLPILGFFFGFVFGAQTVQAIFGTGFLSTISSWIVGFFFAMAFAVMSYLFYFLAVALVAGALGYAVGVGLLQAIGLDFGFLVWLVGIILGAAVAVGAIVFNVQKWVVIVATAVLGAGTIVSTFLFLFSGQSSGQLLQNPVRVALQASPFWTITFLVIAAVGVLVQYQMNRRFEVETYERLTGMTAPSDGTGEPAVGQMGEVSS